MAGIPALSGGRLIGRTPHRLRGTFTTSRVEIGPALPKVQKLPGHSDITTTLRYVEDSAGLHEAQARVAQAMGLGVSSEAARKPRGGRTGGKTSKPNPRNRKQVKQVQH